MPCCWEYLWISLSSPLDFQISSLVLLSIMHRNVLKKEKKNRSACWFVNIKHHAVINGMYTESCQQKFAFVPGDPVYMLHYGNYFHVCI